MPFNFVNICTRLFIKKKLSLLISHYISRMYIQISILMKIFIVRCLEQYQVQAKIDGLPGG